MIETAAALYKFWSGFDLPAATVMTVPEEWDVPYITYSLVESEPLYPTSHYAQVWFRSTDNAAMLEKVDEIKAAIGEGIRLACTDGYVVIRPQTPFSQIMIDQNKENRYAYLNMQINCYHE